jgi:hypothetical protein
VLSPACCWSNSVHYEVRYDKQKFIENVEGFGMKNLVEKLMVDFRVADRELFNGFFRIDQPWENQEVAWMLVERFNDLELVLFQKMVSEALGIGGNAYGEPQKDILLKGKEQDGVSALINREVDSGYWDFPVSKIPIDAEIQFICFFDWDVLAVRDNKFVRGRIASCASSPVLVGKHALVDVQVVSYRLPTDTGR